MEPSLENILAWLKENWFLIAFIISCVFQFVPPIKIKPFSIIIRAIGRIANEAMQKDISTIQQSLRQVQNGNEELYQQIEDLQEASDKSEIDRIRSEVLCFSSSLRNGNLHGKEEFDHILDLNKKYLKLLNKYDMQNGVYEANFDYILGRYKQYLISGFPY